MTHSAHLVVILGIAFIIIGLFMRWIWKRLNDQACRISELEDMVWPTGK